MIKNVPERNCAPVRFYQQNHGGKGIARRFAELYYSQFKTAKSAEGIFRPGKARPRRLAGSKSRGLNAARAEKAHAESLD